MARNLLTKTPILAHPLILIQRSSSSPPPARVSSSKVPQNSSAVYVLKGVRSRMKTLLVAILVKYDMNVLFAGNVWAVNNVLEGWMKRRETLSSEVLVSSVKNLMVRASGSCATAPDIEAIYFVSGNSIRAICGVKDAATNARSNVLLSLLAFKADAEGSFARYE